MPRPSVTATTTVTQTTALNVSAQVKAMLKARCQEYVEVSAKRKEAEARIKRIGAEIEELFVKAGQAEALAAGTDIDGHKVKKVSGVTRTLDKMGLMNAVGLTPDELDAWYDEKPKKAYVKISAPGERDGDE